MKHNIYKDAFQRNKLITKICSNETNYLQRCVPMKQINYKDAFQ